MKSAIFYLTSISKICIAIRALTPHSGVYTAQLKTFCLAVSCVLSLCAQHLGMVWWWSRCLHCSLQDVTRQSHCYYCYTSLLYYLQQRAHVGPKLWRKLFLFKDLKVLWQWSYLFLKVKTLFYVHYWSVTPWTNEEDKKQAVAGNNLVKTRTIFL